MLKALRRSTLLSVGLPVLVITAAFSLPYAASAQVQIGSVFNSQGPAPATGPRDIVGSADSPPNGTVTGAIQAIAADPGDPNTLYVGAVNGGIWKSTHRGFAWTAPAERPASPSTSPLNLPPTHSTPSTLR